MDPQSPHQPVLIATRLRCESFSDPLGIDEPRLSWNLESSLRQVRQGSRHILVASTPELLAGDCGDLWDTGRVGSEESLFVRYAGGTLMSGRRYFWKVRVWDEEGNTSPWSEPSSWQMGLPAEKDWGGTWIGATGTPTPPVDRHTREENKMDSSADPLPTAVELADLDRDPGFAAVLLRREIHTSVPVRRATAFACGLGASVLEINGRPAGGSLLEPAHTNYDRRVLYQIIDVTSHWRDGWNAVAVTLGNSWYHLPVEDYAGSGHAPWRASPRLRLRIELEMADGTTAALVSDETWKWQTGPITFNCIRGGEDQDARRERPGWNLPGYDETGWHTAVAVSPPKGRLVAELLHPVRIAETVAPANITPGKPGEWIFDFGTNLAGWARLRIRGVAGRTVELEFPGASTHTHGRYQIDRFTLKGGSEETFEPLFTHHGFRTVIVRGLVGEPTPEMLTACNVHTDMPCAGEFSCSNDQINTLQAILRRTAQNYILHHPADPTREKLVWSQDVMNMFATQSYNFDSVLMYRKWFADMLDSQDERGFVPPYLPAQGWMYDGSWNGVWWAGMIIYLPWMLHQFYGDKRPLEEGYPAMKAFLDWLRTLEGRTEGVWCSQPEPFGKSAVTDSMDGLIAWGLGDWGEVDTTHYPKRTPVALTATCGYAYFHRILGEAASLLGKESEAEYYAAESARIARALNRTFLNPATGEYSPDSQTAQILPLHLGLVPGDLRQLAIDKLVQSLAATGNHLSTGFEGTPFLLTGLSDLGLADLAWTVATRPDYPGWFDVVFNRHATTFMEFWDASHVQMPSCQGAIGEWFFRNLAGIQPDPDGPGFRKIIIKPDIVGDLSWVKAHHDSPYGTIASEWQRDDEILVLNISIPANTTATVYLPAADGAEVTEGGNPVPLSSGVRFLRMEANAAVFAIGSGNYRFQTRPPQLPCL